jgi:predicted acylesterase/phospholipase RssA
MTNIPGQKLKPKDVHYLSLEGGGGKGVAYLGALAAFAESEIGILEPTEGKKGKKIDYIIGKQIKGISGSSAGAITATLLAIGFTLSELYEFTNNGELLGKFYDEGTRRRIPNIGRGPTACRDLEMPTDLPLDISLLDWFRPSSRPKVLLYLLTYNDKIKEIILKALLNKFLPSSVSKTMADKLKKDPVSYLKNLLYDYGLFSGCYSRAFFEGQIAQKTKDVASKYSKNTNGESFYGLTFDKFVEKHNIDLVLTGTNLETAESKYFCAKYTPDFKVADALRISMSFPFAFKPIIIKEGKYHGTWIDGGVLNNNPMHAFDSPDGQWNENLLGLRLDIDQPNTIEDVVDFAKALISVIMSNSELGQIRSSQQKAQTIQLDTEGLSTLDFTPPVEYVKKSMKKSSSRVMKYFDLKDHGEVVEEIIDNKRWY